MKTNPSREMIDRARTVIAAHRRATRDRVAAQDAYNLAATRLLQAIDEEGHAERAEGRALAPFYDEAREMMRAEEYVVETENLAIVAAPRRVRSGDHLNYLRPVSQLVFIETGGGPEYCGPDVLTGYKPVTFSVRMGVSDESLAHPAD